LAPRACHPRLVRRLAPLLALTLAGCGSTPAAELPAPAGPPVSVALAERPAGRVFASTREPSTTTGLDRSGDRLLVGGRSTRTCREPIASAMVERGKQIAVLCGRERVLDLYDAKTLKRLGRVGGGIGPTALATNGVELLYVTDVLGNALLVYHTRPFEFIRRVHLGGGPYAIAYDRGRWGLWIALAGSNRLAYYAAGARPVPRDEFPSIRNAREVIAAADAVTVRSDSETQVVRRRSR
jgi:hypothetical protein